MPGRLVRAALVQACKVGDAIRQRGHEADAQRAGSRQQMSGPAAHDHACAALAQRHQHAAQVQYVGELIDVARCGQRFRPFRDPVPGPFVGRLELANADVQFAGQLFDQFVIVDGPAEASSDLVGYAGAAGADLAADGDGEFGAVFRPVVRNGSAAAVSAIKASATMPT